MQFYNNGVSTRPLVTYTLLWKEKLLVLSLNMGVMSVPLLLFVGMVLVTLTTSMSTLRSVRRHSNSSGARGDLTGN
jgi:hypothetical protein